MNMTRSETDRKDHEMQKEINAAFLRAHPFRIRGMNWNYLAKTNSGLVWVYDVIGQNTLKFMSERSAKDYMKHNFFSTEEKNMVGKPIKGTIVRFK